MAGLSGVGVFWAFSSLLAALAASVGFYMPFWLRGYMGEMPVYFGVFRRCNYPRMNEYGNLVMVEECGRYSTFGDIPSLSWQIGTLTIGVGCGLAMLVSLTAILAVCIQGIVSPTIARVAGILQLCAGKSRCSPLIQGYSESVPRPTVADPRHWDFWVPDPQLPHPTHPTPENLSQKYGIWTLQTPFSYFGRPLNIYNLGYLSMQLVLSRIRHRPLPKILDKKLSLCPFHGRGPIQNNLLLLSLKDLVEFWKDFHYFETLTEI